MKIDFLLANDTSAADQNPGCKATVYALKKMILKQYPGAVIDSIPVGYAYTRFSRLHRFFKGSASLRTSFSWAVIGQWIWRGLGIHVAADILKVYSFPVCVINMEGTLHHRQIGAFTLSAIAWGLTKKGVDVWMVNGTVDSLDPFFIRTALSRVQYLSVREDMSASYLEQFSLRPARSIDAVFSLDKLFKSNLRTTTGNRCLYTPGCVLGTASDRDAALSMLQKHVREIRSAGLEPHFLLIDKSEAPFESVLKQMGVPIVKLTDEAFHDIADFLREFALVVAGRYHLAIFSLVAEVPLVPIRSNTHKIESLYLTLGLKGHALPVWGSLQRGIEAALENSCIQRVDRAIISERLKLLLPSKSEGKL